MTKKVGKWKYIAQRLEKENFSKMAEKARQIEKHLKEIYSETITVDFQKDYKSGVVDKMPLRHVIKANSYCVGCGQAGTISESGKCNACLYGRKYGICDDPHSEFGMFFKEIQELKMELKEESAPFNVDCWNNSEDNARRIITHLHNDHIPCRPQQLVILGDALFDNPLRAEDLKDEGYIFISAEKYGFKEIGTIKHLDIAGAKGKVRILRKEDCIIVGDYDASSADDLFYTLRNAEPKTIVLPVYAKVISGTFGRLQRNSRDLHYKQRQLIHDLKGRRGPIGRKPVIIGMAHSKSATKAVRELKVDGFIEYSDRVPSRKDRKNNPNICGTIKYCEGCIFHP